MSLLTKDPWVGVGEKKKKKQYVRNPELDSRLSEGKQTSDFFSASLCFRQCGTRKLGLYQVEGGSKYADLGQQAPLYLIPDMENV